MSSLGTVAAMWRYPVKSLAPQALTEAHVESDGLEGDRAASLMVREGRMRVGKPLRGKEHNLLHTIGEVSRAQISAAGRGYTTELEESEPHYFDAAPISIILDRWLEGISAHVGFEVEPLRFRPNFYIESDTPHLHAAAQGHIVSEASLVGKTLELGDVVLGVREPIERCVTPSYDLETGESNARVLRYLVEERDNLMGIYCDVLRAGTVRAGDALRVVDR